MGRNTAGTETTPSANVLKAKARKKRNRERRDAADQAEANRLSITVGALRHRRFLEVQGIRDEKKRQARLALKEAQKERSRHSYW